MDFILFLLSWLLLYLQLGYTALIKAAEKGHEPVVSQLLAAKANIELQSEVSTRGDEDAAAAAAIVVWW